MTQPWMRGLMKNSRLPERPSAQEHGSARLRPRAAFTASGETARLDHGCVTRAFAWAGETVWNQGHPTLPETETGFSLPDYGETVTDAKIKKNLQKLPSLAARWSLDPAQVKLNSARESIGIAGESAPF